ncbi:MAG: nucleoside hydrolase [Acidobacteria bacterium]|nr:nucleoside hydrolase [Acidobacteriota bacterium]
MGEIRKLGKVLLAALAIAAALGPALADHDPTDPAYRTPVLVDTDMGLDDLAALAALAAAPTIELVSVTTVGGAATPERGAENAARFLDLAGAAGVPVAAGAAFAGEPPRWRAVAESLGGVSLPALSRPNGRDAVAQLRRVLDEHAGEKVVVLALGPLTNLAALLDAAPDAAPRIGAIWLLGGPGERAWNLAADPDAARAVFRAKVPLVLVPEAASHGLVLPAGTPERLEASPALAARLLALAWKGSGHATPPLADAALVAAFLGGDGAGLPRDLQLALDPESRVTVSRGDGAAVLTPPDAVANARLLVSLWTETPPDQPPALDAAGPPLRRLAAFHGHLGPYVVLGYRAAVLARERTGSPGYFDLAVRPVTIGKPPQDCFVDGIQLGSGATTGKGNLKPQAADVVPYAVFTRKGGEGVRIDLLPGLPEMLAREIRTRGVGAVGLRVFAAPLDSLLRVSPVATGAP